MTYKNRVILHLLPDERAALQRMSEDDVRPPAAMLRYLVNREAQARGLLPTKNDCTGPVYEATTGATVAANL